MTDHCQQCGAEILPGMRFCRFCGTATGALSLEEPETRPFPASTPTCRRPAGSTQSAYVPPESSPMEAYAEPSRKRRWPWVLGCVLGCLLLAFGLIGYGLYQGASQLKGIRITEGAEGIEIIKDGKKITIGGLQETSADVITRTIPLAPGGTFALFADIGDVKISTWDEDLISIKAKKHLGSADEKAQVTLEVDTSTPNTVIIRTRRPSGTRAHIDYQEIKLPRRVNIDQISVVRGDVHIEGVEGNVSVRTVSGDVVLGHIRGPVKVQTVSGDVRTELLENADERDTTLESVSGDIVIRFLGPFNANVNLSTTTGDIDVSGDVHLLLKRGFGSKSAHGSIGQGGPPTIHIKTVSGDIRLIH
ncbi:MAG: hypothetical protein D6723_02000 [Acidobacteria bacterium]|nr:MAG: hypothetical protein D6723_02000 [Acidobacteriota bacterium]